MKELTKKQKIFVLKEMIRYYDSTKPDFHKCMCNIMAKIIKHDLCKIGRIDEKVFPEFFNNAPREVDIDLWWFPMNERLPRLEYCKKILKLIESK